MSGGGGKGDSTSSSIKLPPEVEALAKRNLEAAERAGQIGYVPYQGPTVRALNPGEVNSMQQNEAAMSAFGMTPGNVTGSIPAPTTYANGVQGYDPMALYLQALQKIDPAQREAINSFTTPRPIAPPPTAATGGRTRPPGAPRVPGQRPLFMRRAERPER